MTRRQPPHSDRGMGRGDWVPLLGAPTATGKSGAALRLAEHFPIEIVTADAMQVYAGMDIGTAKPTAAERARVSHHLLDVATPAEPFSVADWVRRAETAISDVLSRGRIPLVVGGTGFYLRALCRGMPSVPPADAQVQQQLWREVNERGIGELEEELSRVSPADAERAQKNPRRIVRAVEILRRTGRPPRDFPLTAPRFPCRLTVLTPPFEVLRPRIEARCEQMFASGLAAEVEALLQRFPRQATAMQAIGYKEVAAAIEAGDPPESARDAVVQATLRYAKRQLTWFRKEQAEQRLPLLADEALTRLMAWLGELHASDGG